MSEVKTAPYGSWKSPITSELIVTKSVRLQQIVVDGVDIYWDESRPAEQGRSVVVRRDAQGHIADVTPEPFNVRTTAHEYGGGAFTVAAGTLYFANYTDQRLYAQAPGEVPRPLTPEANARYADAIVDATRSRLICVREDHSIAGQEALATLVAIPLADGKPQVLVQGSDFYSSPRLSPDGSRLAWLSWNHPNMPWDESELWVGELAADGGIRSVQRIAGGDGESVFQPAWSPDGVLHFVADRTGWWNLYRWRNGQREPLCAMEAEFGLPQWVFGMSTYCFVSSTEILCTYARAGIWQIGLLDTATLQLRAIDTPYTMITNPLIASGKALCKAGAPCLPSAIVSLDLTTGESAIVRRSDATEIDPAYISEPQAVEFPTEYGRTAHAFFYPPHNPDFKAPAGERPPLLVISHGGPTGAATATLNLSIQYWTSRGIAVLDVNYGGSTGYGRAYRERLKNQWGIVDVDDCVNGARYLVAQGKADGDRLAIRGGSAGGYTTLCALTFRDTFKAGASYYGVSDAEILAIETHKFESRYLDGLIGPYPERRDLYIERSPIHFIDRLSCALILFQGLEDRIVPPNQAEMMYAAVKNKGLPVAYIPFAGEQHGFRRAENIKRALEAELTFYSRIFGFVPADPSEPVDIANLE